MNEHANEPQPNTPGPPKSGHSRRVTPKGTPPDRSNETATARAVHSAAPSARHVTSSPRWFGWLIGAVLVLSALVIVANYLNWLPGEPSNAWLGIGLVGVLAGLVLATRWR